MASGALEDNSLGAGGRGDDIQAELDRMSSTNDVELELARMKGELTAGSAPAAIEAAQAETAGSRAGLDREGGPVVIVRIMGEGQVEVAASEIDGLNALDTQLQTAVEAGDEDLYRQALSCADPPRTRGRHAGARRRAAAQRHRHPDRPRSRWTRCASWSATRG